MMASRKILTQWLRHAVVVVCLCTAATAAATVSNPSAEDGGGGGAAATNNSTHTQTHPTQGNSSVLATTTVAISGAHAAASTTTTTSSASTDNTHPNGLGVAAAAAGLNSRRNVVDSINTLMAQCPQMLHYIFEAAPHNGAESGVFEEFAPAAASGAGGPNDADDEIDLRSCLAACCAKARNGTCNAVFAYRRKCYHVRCVSNAACMPKQRPAVKERLQMILVSPLVKEDSDPQTWLDVFKESKGGMEFLAMQDELNQETAGGGPPGGGLSFWKQPPRKFHYPRNQESPSYEDEDFPVSSKRVNQMLENVANDPSLAPDDLDFYGASLDPLPKFITCDLEMPPMAGRCPKKEECVPVRENSSTGICKCLAGYERNSLRVCVRDLDYPLLDEAATSVHNMLMAGEELEKQQLQQQDEDSFVPPTTVTPKVIKLSVAVESKEVRLPETEVTLAAFASPDEQSTGMHYKYLWTLITQPKGPMNGTISDQSKSKVILTNLSEGLYTFKVSVSGENGAFGEATANVSVLPESRVNRVPQAIIVPAEHTIRLPITNAILDGSTSSDDDKIVAWHWEVVSGPIGYQPVLPDVSTLHLTDLTSPGNYSFKLTVTDSDNGTNSTTANITVMKETDYAPVANAGDAVILYLPNNNVTLNGTASSDDHEIVAWEWTKDASVEAKAVDMQNTRTPYVQLSNLEQGMYTFVLKVTDSSGQSSTAKVQVCVKPPTNTPPIAVAGLNVTVNLPRNWVLLNGSESHDDIHIQSYEWREVSGPNTAVINKANESVANATGLTLGLYEFQLMVLDDDNNTANDSVWVKIIQEKNAPPVAHAGGDQTVTLPIKALYLNGSKSSDDLAIVKYAWSRDDTSLAAGLIVGDTDKEPVLILTQLSPGHYVFKLTVSDEQGLTNTDTVNVIVQPDPLLMQLVEVTLPMQLSDITEGELNSIIQKLGLLLNDMKIRMRELKYDSRTGATILVFYVETLDANNKPKAVDGLEIEQLLKDKIKRDASILGTVLASNVRTTICQNKCSGHGVCNIETRACECESFWMSSVTYYWGIDEANCDWSILYVFVGVILTFLLLSGVCWGIALTCRQTKKPTRSRPKVQKYSLLGTHDEEAPRVCRKTSFTDSETDSDVLFETRTKPNGLRSTNGSLRHKHSHGKYAHTKLSRKVKT